MECPHRLRMVKHWRWFIKNIWKVIDPKRAAEYILFKAGEDRVVFKISDGIETTPVIRFSGTGGDIFERLENMLCNEKMIR